MNMPIPDLKADRFRRIAAVIVILCFVSSGWWSQFEWNIIAVKYTTDQHKLARIALETELRGVRLDAVEKLTDQALLGKIAVESADSWARLDAVRKLSDSTVLVKVAFDAKDNEVRNIAYDKVSHALAELTALSTSAQDPTTRVYASVLLETHRALQSAPKGQWERLFGKISEITSLLTVPGVRADLGEVKKVQIQWEPRSAEYMVVGAVPGESFTVSVKFGKREQAMIWNWTTDFPYRTSKTHFIDAWINVVDLYRTFGGQLSETTHAELALDSGDPEIRRAAMEKITDQITLAKIAMKDDWPYCDTSHIRKAAVQKLTDQAALAKVAMEDKSWEVRFSAVQSLTRQDILAKIASNDSDLAVRNAALARITDPAVAKKIAPRIREGAAPSAVIAAPVKAESAVGQLQPAPKELTDPAFVPRPAQ